MKTKVKIVPAHDLHGFVVQFLVSDTWVDYGHTLQTREAAEKYMRDTAKFESWKLSNVRVQPKVERIEAWPTQNYIEELWLKGYQGARAGEENRYSPGCDNYTLWQEGAKAFKTGKKLFA